MRIRLAAALALIASPALAHPGDHSHVGVAHLLEPDHLAMLGLVGLVMIAAFMPTLVRAAAKRRSRR